MAEKLSEKDIKHNIIIIKINKSYYVDMPARELYEYTRGYWKRKIESVEIADYALAVSNGLVVEVFSIINWIPARYADNIVRSYDPDRYHDRIAFNGYIAPEEVRSYYLGRDVSSLYTQGEANPVKLFLANGSDADDMSSDIHCPMKPRAIYRSDKGITVECPNCNVTFRKAKRCPECGQVIDYDNVIIKRSKFKTIDEWAANTSIEGATTSEVVRFVRDICKTEGFSYHIGTSDLVLEIAIRGDRVNLFRFSGDRKSFSFQPKAVIEGLLKAKLSDDPAYSFMDRMRAFLTSDQKNIPYDRLNGYYNVDYSILLEHSDALSGLLIEFKNSIDEL